MISRIVAIALAALALVPFALPSQSLVSLAFLAVVAALLGTGWNIAGGFGGLTSFGHAIFFGVGAYATALLQARHGLSPWLGLPVGAMLGGLIGWLIGVAAFRAGLRGSYFALVTLAFAEAFRVIANSLDYTGGGLGILIPLRPGLSSFQFADRRTSYALALALLAVALAVSAWLRRSRFGARLAAVRESEDAARALGIEPLHVKAAALALSGAITATGGVLYTQTYLYIDPTIAFGPERSVEMLLVAMVGGAGTVLGPLLGALVLQGITEGSRALSTTPGVAPMLYGLVLLAVVGLLPGGIVRLLRGRAA